MSVSIRMEYPNKPLQNSETRRMQIGHFLIQNENVVRKVVAGAAVATGVAVATSDVIGVSAAIGLGVGAAALETAGGQARKAVRVLAGIGIAGAAAFGGVEVDRTLAVLAGTVATVTAAATSGMIGTLLGGLSRVLPTNLMGHIGPIGIGGGFAAVVVTGLLGTATESCIVPEVATHVWQAHAGASSLRESAVGMLQAAVRHRDLNPTGGILSGGAIVGSLIALAYGAVDQANNPGMIGSTKIIVGSAVAASVAATSTALGSLAGPRIAAASAGILGGNLLSNSVRSFAKYLIDDPSVSLLPQ